MPPVQPPNYNELHTLNEEHHTIIGGIMIGLGMIPDICAKKEEKIDSSIDTDVKTA